VPKIEPFEAHAERYDAWFEDHRWAYQSELNAVRVLLPPGRRALEVGVGSGRFAAPLGVNEGVEPSAAMRRLAARRGIRAVDGTAERLPYPDARFDSVILVTTICFVDDVDATLREAFRVLEPGGCIVIGFVDRTSRIGRSYERRRAQSAFYAEARFLSTQELLSRLENAGFVRPVCAQTLFHALAQIRGPEPVRPGYGEGSFVVVRADKMPGGSQ
jgi:ubiquinone/menaquinone biosynthesis C-methylase UbiE